MLPTLRTRRSDTLRSDTASWPWSRMLDGFFDDAFHRTSHVRAAEITEDADAIQVSLEAPGYREDELHVSVENGVLWVSARPSAEDSGEEAERPKVWLREWEPDEWERSFRLPRAVDLDGIEARYEDGILTVVLPKLDEAKPRRIPIGGSGKKGLLGRSGS